MTTVFVDVMLSRPLTVSSRSAAVAQAKELLADVSWPDGWNVAVVGVDATVDGE